MTADTVTSEVVATQTVNPFSSVTVKGVMASSNTIADLGKVCGVSTVITQTGFVVAVVISGIVTNPSWNFQKGTPVFLNGLTLSMTPPTTGFCQMIGLAKSPTSVFVQIHEPYMF